jgi:hypothetical protein
MAPTPRKFPRRYAQRQSLRNGKNISLRDLRSQVQRQRDKSRDSGYDSTKGGEAEYLNGLINKFEVDGPQISNLGEVAKDMIQTEQHMWLM